MRPQKPDPSYRRSWNRTYMMRARHDPPRQPQTASVWPPAPGSRVAALRHAAASLAIASGADIKVVQQMLGHKSATMTLDQYGHLFPDRLDGVEDAIDAHAQKRSRRGTK
jgi:integrase